MTPVANFATSNAGIVDTIGKFATSVNNTVGKFTAGVKYTGGKYWEHYHIADTLKSELEGKFIYCFFSNLIFYFSFHILSTIKFYCLPTTLKHEKIYLYVNSYYPKVSIQNNSNFSD
jgi:hypothetical protein